MMNTYSPVYIYSYDTFNKNLYVYKITFSHIFMKMNCTHRQNIT